MDREGMIRINYPAVRQFTADTGKIARGRHIMRALLEVDVTETLQKLKVMRAPGQKVSFLAFFIKALADSTAAHPPVDGIRQGRHAVVAFQEIDVATIVEKSVNGVGVPLPLVLREANQKTAGELSDEIQLAVQQKVEGAGDYVLGGSRNAALMRAAAAMPQWMRLFFMRVFVLRNPVRLKQMMGTVMVTSLGTTGRVSGWIIPASMHPLSIGIGSLQKKPAIYHGEIQKRDILHLTVAIDHDVIDGMPALRFVDALVSKLETGEGLDAA